VRQYFHARRVVVIAMGVAIVVALGIGLWPVNVDVSGNASYSCGSGFFHSTHAWTQDSLDLQFQRVGTDDTTGLPSTVCPNRVYNRRDLALLVVAFSLALGLIAQILIERPREPNYGSTMWVNRRRSVRRIPGATRLPAGDAPSAPPPAVD
jgi:hypothetical protein